MRLDSYLIERRGIKLKEDVVIDLLTKNCQKAIQAWNKGFKIFRGMSDYGDFAFIDPKKGTARRSANTRNYYTSFLSQSHAWKDFPKRSRSLICSTKENYATDFGKVYAIFPYDGSRIGICGADDFWESFNTLNWDMDNINYQIEQLIIIAFYLSTNTWNPKRFDKSFQIFRKGMSLFDKTIKKFLKDNDKTILFHRDLTFILEQNNEYAYRHTFKWFTDIYNQKRTFYDTLEQAFDPIMNGFKVIKVGQSMNMYKSTMGNEIWTDGQSIAMAYESGEDTERLFTTLEKTK